MVQNQQTLARLESYKENNYGRPEIKNFKDKELGNKGQTKDLKRKRRLSELYGNSNGLKIAYI